MEGIKKTHHPKIKIAAPLENQEVTTFVARFNELLTAGRMNKDIFLAFKALVPEYKIHGDYLNEAVTGVSDQNLKNG
ncbi:Nucleoside-diphosphate sugar epimerase [Leptospira borgpetersenii str. 4E]|nr:Nucleoside-diphosphate sugar epimerase [Leptospira borgpetersenii str. 4E]